MVDNRTEKFLNMCLNMNIHEYLKQISASLFYWNIYSKLGTDASLNAKIEGVNWKVAGLLKHTAAIVLPRGHT